MAVEVQLWVRAGVEETQLRVAVCEGWEWILLVSQDLKRSSKKDQAQVK